MRLTAFRAGGTWQILLVALLVAMAAASTFTAGRAALTPRGSHDFGIPLKAAGILQHRNVYTQHLADPGQTAPAASGPGIPTPIHPVQVPSVLALLWPFTLLPWPIAQLSWLIANLLSTVGLVVLAARRFAPGRSVAFHVVVTSLFVMSVSWRNVIGNGQHLIVSLFLFLLAMELADRKRNWLAGLALAASLLKYTVIGVLLPVFALRRQWQAVAIAVAVHLLLTATVAIRLGENPITLVVQSFSVARELQGLGYIDLFSLGADVVAPELLSAAAALLFLAALWPLRRAVVTDEGMLLTSLCFVSVILVYHRAYDMVVLIIPLLVAIDRWREERLIAALIFANVGLTWFVSFGRGRIDWFDGEGIYHHLVLSLWYATAAVLVWRGFRTAVGDRLTAARAGRQ